MGIRHVCMVIAFLGIMYASFSGAFIYAKINILQSIAPVTFSTVICVQYGQGLQENAEEDETSFGDQFPCPILEIRVVNNHGNHLHSEILNAEIQCSVSTKQNVFFKSIISEGIAQDDILTPKFSSFRNRVGKLTRSRSMESPRTMEFKKTWIPQSTFASNQADSVSAHPSKRRWDRINVDPSRQALFMKVWTVRHTLDHNSPLLKPSVRRLIRNDRHHCWPRELNDFRSVKNSIVEFSYLVCLCRLFLLNI